jgi:cell division protein FtsI/penicillin-binding protein 2
LFELELLQYLARIPPLQHLQKYYYQDYFAKYGLREETGIDLPSESAGLTRNLDSSTLIYYTCI